MACNFMKATVNQEKMKLIL